MIAQFCEFISHSKKKYIYIYDQEIFKFKVEYDC